MEGGLSQWGRCRERGESLVWTRGVCGVDSVYVVRVYASQGARRVKASFSLGENALPRCSYSYRAVLQQTRAGPGDCLPVASVAAQ